MMMMMMMLKLGMDSFNLIQFNEDKTQEKTKTHSIVDYQINLYIVIYYKLNADVGTVT